jgi:hypothetical protein
MPDVNRRPKYLGKTTKICLFRYLRAGSYLIPYVLFMSGLQEFSWCKIKKMENIYLTTFNTNSGHEI